MGNCISEFNDIFNSNDVCAILGWSEMSKVLREHIKKDEKKPLLGVTVKSPIHPQRGKSHLYFRVRALQPDIKK